MTDIPLTVNHSEHATILAALRYYQQCGMGDPMNRPQDIHDIAVAEDRDYEVISLADEGIDALCERINFGAEPDQPNVRRFLDLSTVHLSPATRDDWDGDSSRPSWAYPTSYGWFVWAGSDDTNEEEDGLPAEVVACRKFARTLGCDYILFDADAETVEGLEVFDGG